jgi:uncharacterized membrane protein
VEQLDIVRAITGGGREWGTLRLRVFLFPAYGRAHAATAAAVKGSLEGLSHLDHTRGQGRRVMLRAR